MLADEAAAFIRDGMTVGISGFTSAGEPKVVPLALARRAQREQFKINLMSGASLGHDIDGALAEAGALARRLPFQSDARMRQAINRGDIMFVDQHLSETVEMLRAHVMGKIDIAVIEAVAITEDGGIVPSTSVGNSASFAILAEHVIVELNLSQSPTWEGLHDIYIPTRRPYRESIPLTQVRQRIGLPYIPIEPSKILAIVITEEPDSPSPILPPDQDTASIAGHLAEFFAYEVRSGRLPANLLPLQAGIGTVANATLQGLVNSPYEHLTMYSEVLQDSAFALMETGKLDFASCSAVTLSPQMQRHVLKNLNHFKDQFVLRPQEISNHPELIRRLGVIAINTALEADIYGNVNSTHVLGTKMMNGIGGSGDFARNAAVAIFVTKSLAKDGQISSIVPMITHVDHTEHDVDVLVTEVGLADLRGLAPRERAISIIENCVHPHYRSLLQDYYQEALALGGHTPHVLEKAFGWHLHYLKHGTMQRDPLKVP